MEPDVPSAALSRLQITRSKYSFANTPPPPGLRTYTPQQLRNESFIGPPPSQSRPKQRRVKSQSTGSALVLRKTTVEEMMGRTGGGIHYDPMSDPALAGYYARKFGWTVAAQPPSGGARGAGGPARPRGSAGGRTKKKPAAKSKGSTEYTVQVVTSRKSRSASASEKTILIFGVDGKSKKILLSAPGVHFKAGATDTFHVKAGRLGDLLKVKVTNESQRRADSWHLDHVVISRGKGKTAKRWKFPCDKWLSAEEGDRKCSRTLLATKVAASKPVYDVDVYTADKRGAGTDANVFITLFGVKGQGVRTKLDDKKNNFERNMVDHFVVEPRQPLGKLTKVRIEHDNKGIAAGWCLDQIVITHRKTGNKYFFPCHKWLAKDEGDGQISRDLPVAGADGKVTATEYLVEVFTGDVRYAGTDANVTIVIVGENGDIGPKVLDNSKNNFERGKKDTFNLQSPGLGELKSVRISHDNKGVGAAWFLDKVVVTDASTGVPVVFPCNRWLAKGEDDGAISRELTPEGTWTTVPYKVHVQTSDKRWAGTSANVHCELFGKLGSSGRTKLENHKDNFQRGRTDIFVVECRDLGEITHMTIGHDNKGSGPGWHVGAVKLEAPTLGLIYPGSCDQWLAADEGDGQLEREIVFVPENAIKVAKKNVWHCAVTTSDKRNAGTDANVFMTVYGTQGKSEVIPVKSNSDTFERGKTDEFKVELDTLGVLHKLRVWHDNKGGFAGWHLSHIELTHMESGAKYRFDCGLWLAKGEDNGEIMRELPATGPLIKDPAPLLDYKVHVYTGHKRGAGTDANVSCTIYGSKGDTGSRPLQKSETHRNKFEKGSTDVFTVAAVDLGELERIRIGHDNWGLGASWYLDKVGVIDPRTGEETEFPCSRWFSRKEDDGLIERELYRLGANNQVKALTRYSVRIATGKVSQAGTDANVTLTIYGATTDTGPLQLRKSLTYKDPFEKGHIDVFDFNLADIGDIRKIHIGHDGKGVGSGWFLDNVEIECPSQGQKWVFPHSRWLSKGEDDGLIERDILPESASAQSMEAHRAWNVRVFTSDVSNAGTDSKVHMIIYGKGRKPKVKSKKKTKGKAKGEESGDTNPPGPLKTDKVILTNKTDNFERGQMDEFKLDLVDVGDPWKILIGHDNSGLGSAWHLDKVELHDLASDEFFVFKADRWLSKKKGDKNITVEIPLQHVEAFKDGRRSVIRGADEEHQLKTYKVDVNTGDKFMAGTDAKVSVIIYGANGDSGERHLAKSSTHLNKFERNNTDTFEIEAVNLGPLKKVKVWHDNSGPNPKWYLKDINVTDPEDNHQYVFPCSRWLAKGEDDGAISRELGVLDDTAPAELQTKAVSTTYKLSVYTSDVKNAGTDANMHVCLYGQTGDSGDVQLRKSLTNRDKFERGKVDEFELQCIDLGELTKLRIGHDGKGVGSGWHLDKCVVDAQLLGKTWTFPCGRWFSTSEDDKALERTLVPDKGQEVAYEARVPWEVVVHTSDVKGAGTDSNVFMEVYGTDAVGNELKDRVEFTTAVKSSFERGQEDRFNFEVQDVGKPYKIRIGHDNKGLGAAWHLDKVVMINQLTKEAYEFPCGRWLSKSSDDKKIVRELPVGGGLTVDKDGKLSELETKKLDLVKYTINVVTGDVKNAGTNANVTCIIKGANGDSGELPLKKSDTHMDKFERNHTDVFHAECVDLGDLDRVTIWHDSKGLWSSWYLERVEVIANPESDEAKTTTFTCQRWLSKKEDDMQTKRELFADVDVDQAAAKAKKLATKAEKAEKLARQATIKKSKNAEELALAAAGARNAATKASMVAQRAAAGPRAGLVSYVFKTTTGDRPSAGTDAKVWVEVIGRKRANAGQGPAKRNPSTKKGLGRSDSAASLVSGAGDDKVAWVRTTTGRLDLVAKKGNPFERGRVDTFTIEAMDVGQVRKLKIGHNDEGVAAGWYLDSVELGVPSKGRTYNFSCNAWLSSDEGDKRLVRELRPDKQRHEDVPSVPYEIVVYTGDVSNAGTDARVFVQLFGDKGKTDELKLENSSDTFEKGGKDDFKLEFPDVGNPMKLRVGHNNAGRAPGWFLDKIVLRNLTGGQEYVFPCGMWLAKGEGDGKLVRDLALEESQDGKSIALKEKTYKLYVCTGDVSSAGTDANVSCVIFGALGDSGEQKLKSSETFRDKFERGNTDVFSVKCLDLGQLSKLRIWHDSKGLKGASWFLDNVAVVEEETQSRYDFACGQWLSKSKEDKQTMRELACGTSDVKGRSVPYKVIVKTADKAGASTDSDVVVQLLGDQSKSGELLLANEESHFARGQEDEFLFPDIKFLGRVREAKVWLGRKGKRTEADKWIPSEFSIVEVRSGAAFRMKVEGAISEKKHTLALEEVEEGVTAMAAGLQQVMYEVSVHTSDFRGAGTDANVFVTITGANGDTGPRKLAKSKTHRDKFERGRTDVFDLEALDLGALHKLKVWHDNKGLGSAWHLEKIVVKQTVSGEEFVFECNQWLSKKHEDGELERELTVC